MVTAFLCLMVHTGLFPLDELSGAENVVHGSGEEKKNSSAPDLLPLPGDDTKSVITFSAKDSLLYHFDRKSMELMGKARIDREATTVTAPKIVVDLANSTLDAFGTANSSGTLTEPAVFSNREGSFNAEKITYTFTSGKGETTNIASRSSQVIFSGEQVTRKENGELIVRGGTFTTCDDPEPHYWVSSDYMRIIPGSRIIARPFVMYIRPEIFSKRLPAIPVLQLPFMVFPLHEGRASGVIIPRLSHDSDRGYYFSDLGYFWAVNDYVDMRIEGDIAFNGSWRLGERFRYKSGDAFSGILEGEYERFFKGDEDDSDYEKYSSWNLKFEHHQEFDPSSALDMRMQFQGGDRNYDLNTINTETIVNEQADSYASFGKTSDDENSMFSVGYQRSDYLQSSDEGQLLRTEFYQNRYYPFRSGRLGSLGDWRDNVSVTSGASFRALFSSVDDIGSYDYLADANVQVGYYHELSGSDKILFTQGVALQGNLIADDDYSDNRYGMRLTLPFRMQSTLFRHFNVNAGLYFNHYFVGNDLLKSFDSDGILETRRNGSEGFSTWNFNADVSTRLYGTLQTPFLEGLTGLKAIRHTLIPVISYTWNPDFTGSDYDYYGTVYDGSGYLRYNRFEHSVYHDIPEGQSSVGLTLKNIFHGRFASSGDARGAERTVQLLSLSASTSYNFAAGRMPWAPLLITASSTALSPNFLLSAGALYDFYSFDRLSGERIDRLQAEDGKGLLRFLSGYFNMSFNMQGKNRSGSSGRPEALRAEQAIFRERFSADDFSYVDYDVPWKLRLSLFLRSERSDPLEDAETTALLNASAKVALSKNWQVGVNTGYDIEQNKFVFPMLQVYRDLHCWQMGFQWVPSGEFNSYSFQIGLKASQFDDIRFKTGGKTKGWTE